MANQIRHKRGTAVPSASDFAATAELLVDTATGHVFNKNDSNAVIQLATTSTTQTFTNKVIGETKETVFAITDGSSVDLNPANGPIQTWTLGANRTATANNFEAGQSMLLMIADGSAYAITWPTITFVGGTAPTLATSGFSVIELWKVSTTLYAAHVGDVA